MKVLKEQSLWSTLRKSFSKIIIIGSLLWPFIQQSVSIFNRSSWIVLPAIQLQNDWMLQLLLLHNSFEESLTFNVHWNVLFITVNYWFRVMFINSRVYPNVWKQFTRLNKKGICFYNIVYTNNIRIQIRVCIFISNLTITSFF